MTVKTYTGWEYMLIDVANNTNMDLDKKTFEERIEWAETNLNNLEVIGENMGDWKERPMYAKAVMAVRKAQAGKPTGHLVGLDAVCSGLQIMSAVTGCMSGGKATGLVDPDVRSDAYTDCTNIMNSILMSTNKIPRKDIKNAVMTHLYGSKAEPKALFGEDTVELDAFYKAMYQLAPGASDMLVALINSWDPEALEHSWQLPDGHDVVVPVFSKEEDRVEVDELGGASFTYAYRDYRAVNKGVKNAANIVHSLDSYLLRSLIRRCNYDVEWTHQWIFAIEDVLMMRALGEQPVVCSSMSNKAKEILARYKDSLMADVVILDHLTKAQLSGLSTTHLEKLVTVLRSCTEHEPFPIITVHDDFKAHVNNLNYMRMHYRNILAELAESEVLSDLLSQLYGRPVTVNKLSHDLPEYIRNSNYAIC